jgi:site-specific DNA recombinase
LHLHSLEIESRLSDRRMELASLEAVSQFVEDLRRLLEKSESLEKRAFVRSFIKKIIFQGKEATVTYTIRINGLIEEKTGVLPIVKYGGR